MALQRLYFIGEFASNDALWRRYPSGGIEGEYVSIDGTDYGWNKYTRRWEDLDGKGLDADDSNEGIESKPDSSETNTGGRCCCLTPIESKIKTNAKTITALKSRVAEIEGMTKDHNAAIITQSGRIGQIEFRQQANEKLFSALSIEIENLVYCHCGNEDDRNKDFPALLRGEVYRRTELSAEDSANTVKSHLSLI
ncbi:MAG: hypothetical protein IJ764_00430 [Bacteroidales bacterium]|nr:hypothetical protein [Bacteroidales bacterium]